MCAQITVRMQILGVQAWGRVSFYHALSDVKVGTVEEKQVARPLKRCQTLKGVFSINSMDGNGNGTQTF